MPEDLNATFRFSPPPIVDAFDFARRGQVLTGAFSVLRLERLLDGLPDQPVAELTVLEGPPILPGVVRYVIEGRRTKDDRSQLVVTVQAKLVLECQRCLGPLVLPIDRQTVFELVRRESDLGDEEIDEEDLGLPEKIVGSPKFDLCDLVEDELILEVPYVPRHEVCPETVDLDAQAEEEAGREEPLSPFAVLSQLKTKGQ
ncbi:YceD family protein [Zwartia sp.]|uniref:YceD family protein n=1 Tax=Zwartia sp. TaxID=2978004 RepID=UPI002726AF26|nr:YceD family protein [Zwartia sp.]MDO9026079.1 YceD family protein [Zwartia sp.]